MPLASVLPVAAAVEVTVMAPLGSPPVPLTVTFSIKDWLVSMLLGDAVAVMVGVRVGELEIVIVAVPVPEVCCCRRYNLRSGCQDQPASRLRGW
jgi:hypothetical protein